MLQSKAGSPPQPGVQGKVSRGLVALFVRQVLAYGALFVGNILLSRWLSPGVYGLFAAVLAFQATLQVFSDAGLGPALVQRAREPEPREISSLFTVQLLIFATLAGAVWVAAPWLAASANLEIDATNILRLLALIFMVTSVRSIQAVLLERQLRFDAIALAETVSTVAYQVVLVALVWFGVGIPSIIWALAVKYISDLVIVVYYQRWRPSLSWQPRLVWPFLRFGIGMQAVRVLAYGKDYLPVLLLVPLLGLESAGHWSWTLAYIGIPVYFNRLVDRIMFPAYSRVQEDRDELGGLAGMALWLNFAIGLPVVLVLLVFATQLIPLIYGSTWLVTLPIVALLAPNMVGAFVTSALFPILFATGQSSRAVRLFAFWVLLTVVGALAGMFYGQLAGMAAAYSAATLVMGVLIIRAVRGVAAVRLWRAVQAPVLASILASAGAAVLLHFGLSWPVALLSMAALYGPVVYAFDRDRIHSLVTGIVKV
jgi:O-antigen/teichoic acid export membrane protein